jgi:hypothetical protein
VWGVRAVLVHLGGVLTRSPVQMFADYAVELGLEPTMLSNTLRDGAAMLAECEVGESAISRC